MRAKTPGHQASRVGSNDSGSGRSVTPPRYGIGAIDGARPSPAQGRLPSALALGIERLAGVPMQDVQVHRHSPEPARLRAAAFARGNDIHLGPGSDRHLAHEAWHVAQQRQGRVQATHHARGHAINHDPGLEREADLMGAMSLGGGAFTSPPSSLRAASRPSPQVTQCLFVDANDFKGLIEEQTLAQKYPDEEVAFTTVGFEHEFAQMTDGPLLGLTHVEVGESAESMDYTGLNFKLETDADNALELVSPPFFVETLPGAPIPKPADVAKIDTLIKTELARIVAAKPKMSKLVSDFEGDGLHFAIGGSIAGVANITPSSEMVSHDKDPTHGTKIAGADIKNISLAPSRKGAGLANISSQINFATDARTYDTIQRISTPPDDAIGLLLSGLADTLYAVLATEMGKVATHRSFETPIVDVNMGIFLREAARALAGQASVRSIAWMQGANADLYKGDHASAQYRNKLTRDSSNERSQYELHRSLRSHVKDVGGAWIKDTLANFGLGLLDPEQWRAVRRMIFEHRVGLLVAEAMTTAKVTDFEPKLRDDVRANLFAGADLAQAALGELSKAIFAGNWTTRLGLQKGMAAGFGPEARPEFGTHDPRWFAARQDTIIPAAYVKTPTAFADRRLHVVEGRGDHAATLLELHASHLIATTTLTDQQIATDTGVPKARVTQLRALSQ